MSDSEFYDSPSTDEDVEVLTLLRQYHNQVVVPHEEGESSNRGRFKRRHIPGDRLTVNESLTNDYFVDNAKYPSEYFKGHFRMSKRLFLRIVEGISNYSHTPILDYVRQKVDGCGKMGFPTIQKVTSALCQLAYGTSPDAFDKYLQMAKRTSHKCFFNFAKCMIDIYANVYMRKPTADDIQRLYEKHRNKHGFSGMLGSIDCMHWAWAKCPNAWKRKYTRGDHGYPTIMLEVVASYDMWIWHAYFGVVGANNDLNVLNSSPLFNVMLDGSAQEQVFKVNGV